MKKILLLILLTFSIAHGYVGHIVLKKGTVSIERDTTTISVKNGTKVDEKDIISTKIGKAQIKFDDKTVITIGNNSVFKIEEYLFDTKKPKVKFNFTKGAFKAITGKIGKIAPKNFKMQMKTATIGIRGTIVLGTVGNPVENIPDTVACLGGEIGVANINTPNIVVPVPAGQVTSVPPAAPPTPPAILTAETFTQMNEQVEGMQEEATPPQNDNQGGNEEGDGDSPPPPNDDPLPPPLDDGNAPIGESDDVPPLAETPTEFVLTSAADLGTPPELDTLDDAIDDNLDNEIVDDVVEDIAEDLHVNPDDIQEQINEGEIDPGLLPTNPDDPIVNPDDPIIDPTDPDLPDDPIIDPTDPDLPDDPIIDPTDPDLPDDPYTPGGDSGGGEDHPHFCPPGTTGTYPDCVPVQNNSGRSQAMTGHIMYALDTTGNPYGGISSSSYLLTENTLTGTNTLTFYDNDGGTISNAVTSPRTIDINETFSMPEANSSYSGYSIVGTHSTNFSSAIDANSSYSHTGTSTIYSDDMQEFFIHAYTTTLDGLYTGEKLLYLETIGVKSSFSSLPTSGIATYNAPYSAEEPTTNLNFGNKKYLAYKLPIDITNDEIDIFLGDIIDDGSGKAKTTGISYSANPDMTIELTSNQAFNGYLYGSFYQGIDMFGIITESGDGMKNAEGYAGYRNPTITSATAPSGELALEGYANALLNDGTFTKIDTKNFTYNMSRTNGAVNSGSIDLTILNLGSVTFPSSYTNSSYINDDYFATVKLLGGDSGWLVAVDNFGQVSDDYVSWGYYAFKDTNGTLYPSTWVAGAESALAKTYLENLGSKTLLYQGKAMGSVKDNGTFYPIDYDANNEVQIKLDLGNSKPIVQADSYISFKYNSGSSSMNLTLSNSSSSITYDTDATLSTSFINTSGSLNYFDATFYGTNAEGLGGVFGYSTGFNSVYAQGTIKTEKKSETINSFALTGLATSSYYDDINTSMELQSVRDPLSLSFIDANTTSGSLVLINNDDNTTRKTIDLSSSTVSFVNSMNDFNITTLYNSCTDTMLYTETSNSNDYVSWGYWVSTDDGSPTGTTVKGRTDNFWVAGVDHAAASTYINTLMAGGGTVVTYNGSFLGSVYVSSTNTLKKNILPSDIGNAVHMKFDFGGGSGAIHTDSYIQFSDSSNTWSLKPTANVANGSFIGGFSGSSHDGQGGVITGEINGKFFGSHAEAIGGTVKAISTNDMDVTGVFKALDVGGGAE